MMIRYVRLWFAPSLLLGVPLASQETVESLPVQYGKDLLAAFSARWNMPVELDYRSKCTVGPEDVTKEWLIRGVLGRWDSRRVKRDRAGNIVSLRVERGGAIYDVGRTKTGWEATIKLRKGATTFDSLCPLQRYLSAVSGKAWPDAMHDHAPVEVWRAKREEGSFVVLRMPLLPDYLDVVKKGAVIRNFLCWEVWMQRDEAGLRIDQVLGIASAQVSKEEGPPGTLVNNHRALEHKPVRPEFGTMPCVVVQRIQFGGFTSAQGRLIPRVMGIETTEGRYESQLEGLQARKKPIADADLAFQAPEEFGVVGRLHDARSNKTTFFGEWPGKEDKVLNALVSNGERLLEKQKPANRWLEYILFAIAMVFGLAVIMKWSRDHRAREAA